jgi:hypothetical protein
VLPRHIFSDAHEIGPWGHGHAVADLPGQAHEAVGEVLAEGADDASVGNPTLLVAEAAYQLLDKVFLAEGEGGDGFRVGAVDPYVNVGFSFVFRNVVFLGRDPGRTRLRRPFRFRVGDIAVSG